MFVFFALVVSFLNFLFYQLVADADFCDDAARFRGIFLNLALQSDHQGSQSLRNHQYLVRNGNLDPALRYPFRSLTEPTVYQLCRSRSWYLMRLAALSANITSRRWFLKSPTGGKSVPSRSITPIIPLSAVRAAASLWKRKSGNLTSCSSPGTDCSLKCKNCPFSQKGKIMGNFQPFAAR